jgi:single stranded DNA-binding protein
MNFVVLTGNIGQDPKTGQTSKGTKWANVSIATKKKFKDEYQTTWHNVVAYGRLAEQIANAKKGNLATVVGEIQNEEYTKDGQTRYISKVYANSFTFMPKQTDSNAATGATYQDNVGNTFSEDDIPY